MIDIQKIGSADEVTPRELDAVCAFLHKHLERYGDRPEDIRRAIAYAVREHESPGGFVLVGRENETITGAVVINRTGMSGYIPENILVYIAIHGGSRGRGYGRQLMERVIAETEGGIALHVEPDNPARHLYERLGFTSKYLEMRLTR